MGAGRAADDLAATTCSSRRTTRSARSTGTAATPPPRGTRCTPPARIRRSTGTARRSSTEPTGHIVGTFVLEPQGADFKSRNPFNLLASMDEWTSPIMAEVGPDGFVWVIDWYAYIVQHNPTPQGYENGPGNAYVTPRRDDHKHGRIYRITYSGATPAQVARPVEGDAGRARRGAAERQPALADARAAAARREAGQVGRRAT